MVYNYISGIFPANWWMDYARSHLLGEPETTIDWDLSSGFHGRLKNGSDVILVVTRNPELTSGSVGR